MRPTYAMLLRHPWLAPLMKPPTISEDEEAEAAAEAGAETPASGGTDSHSETADKEVADWVRSAIERKLSGKMGKSDKPALHAAPLDAVPGSPLLDRQGLRPATFDVTSLESAQDGSLTDNVTVAAAAAVADAAAIATPEPRDGVTIEGTDLIVEHVHSMDFADGVAPSSKGGPNERESERRTGDQAQSLENTTIDGSAQENQAGQ